MKILVGDTGFVGSNLKKIMQFDLLSMFMMIWMEKMKIT